MSGVLVKYTLVEVKNKVDYSKPLLRRFLLRQIRFNTNYNLQQCPPIARLNFDLTPFSKSNVVKNTSRIYQTRTIQYSTCRVQN